MNDQQIIADLRQRNLLLTQKLALTEVRLEDAVDQNESLKMSVQLLVEQRGKIADVVKQFPEAQEAVKEMLQKEVADATRELNKLYREQGRTK